MIIRRGVYTIFKGVEMSVTEYYGHGLSQEIEMNHRIISYPSEYGQIDGFLFDEMSSKFKKDIHLTELSNAFLVTTKVVFKGKEFVVEPYYGDDIHLHIATKDLVLGEELGFYELHDGLGNPYYLGEINKIEVEKIWEERTLSDYNFPFPNNIEKIKEIKAV